ncbi:hypothetical protein ACJMK2_012664 [Sinanodonta woodiana]|uniref:Uncharacterized protein n=1 Tax=Sinanodonta woodiana TaxID=1069815 RepID=A0ABD3VAV1_SINWO
MRRKVRGDMLGSKSHYLQLYRGNKQPWRNQSMSPKFAPPTSNITRMDILTSFLGTSHRPISSINLEASVSDYDIVDLDERPSRTSYELISFNEIKNSLDFGRVDWTYFYTAQNSWSLKEKLEYFCSISHSRFEKPVIKIQAAFHLGYYMCKYYELDRLECFNVIQEHMSLSHSRKYRQLYLDLGNYRTLAHCTVSLRHMINRIAHVRNLIKGQSQEEIQFLLFPPNRDPYQFLKAYEEWYNLKESAVYQLGLPDNHCSTTVIEQHTQGILKDITKDSIWQLQHFLNSSAEENRYVLMYDKGSSGNCILLHRDETGKFSLEDNRLECLKNADADVKVHLLRIR